MDEEAVEALRGECSVQYEPGLAQARDDLLAAVAAVRALIVRNVTRVDRELLDAAPALEVVGRLGVGLDNIDLDACAERGIAVFPATGANAVSVAEYVLTAMLTLRRPVYGATARVAAGERASALGMRIAALDPYLAPDDPAWAMAERVEELPDLLRMSDALSIHVPSVELVAALLCEAHQLVEGPLGLRPVRGRSVRGGFARCGLTREEFSLPRTAESRPRYAITPSALSCSTSSSSMPSNSQKT